MRLQDERKLYEEFMGSSCPTDVGDIDESIYLCRMMIQYSTDLNDKEGVSYFRKLLQENKTQRRALTI